MAAIFNASYNFTNGWNNDSATIITTSTGSVPVDVGYTIVVFAGVANYDVPNNDVAVPIISDNYNLQWSKEFNILNDQYCPMVIWSYTTNRRMLDLQISLSYNQPTSTSHLFGGKVVVWSNAGGIGAKISGIGTATSPSLNLTTTQNNSNIITYMFDWIPNSAASRTWSTINGYTPTAVNGLELDYQLLANYMIAGAYWPDVGSTGVKVVTFNHTNTHKYTMAALEILTAPVNTNAFPAPDTIPRINNITSIQNITSITF